MVNIYNIVQKGLVISPAILALSQFHSFLVKEFGSHIASTFQLSLKTAHFQMLS